MAKLLVAKIFTLRGLKFIEIKMKIAEMTKEIAILGFEIKVNFMLVVY
jgi:hypothetical protein